MTDAAAANLEQVSQPISSPCAPAAAPQVQAGPAFNADDVSNAAVANAEQAAQPAAAPGAPAAPPMADVVMLEAVAADVDQQPPEQAQFVEAVCERTRSRKRTAEPEPESATHQAAAAAAVGGDASAAAQKKRQRRTEPAATAAPGETLASHSDFALHPLHFASRYNVHISSCPCSEIRLQSEYSICIWEIPNCIVLTVQMFIVSASLL